MQCDARQAKKELAEFLTEGILNEQFLLNRMHDLLKVAAPRTC